VRGSDRNTPWFSFDSDWLVPSRRFFVGGSLSPRDGIVLEDLCVLGVRIVSCARPRFIVRRRTVSYPARWFHRPGEAAERNGWLIRYHLLWYFLFTPCITRAGKHRWRWRETAYPGQVSPTDAALPVASWPLMERGVWNLLESGAEHEDQRTF
jgi:hypothetical protein